MSPSNILRRTAARAATGYSDTQFDVALRAGEVPQPIKLGIRSVGWIEDELLSWQLFKAAQRDGTTDCKTWKEFHVVRLSKLPPGLLS
jgi:prophage regulatory protein